MAYEVPALPYDFGALEPHIDAKTMEIHHDKHHQAYVDKVNAALEGTDFDGKPIEEVLRNLDSLPADKQKAEEIFTGRKIPISVPISLKDFSQEIGVKTNRLLLHLMKQGIMANQNTTLDEETAEEYRSAFNRAASKRFRRFAALLED